MKNEIGAVRYFSYTGFKSNLIGSVAIVENWTQSHIKSHFRSAQCEQWPAT